MVLYRFIAIIQMSAKRTRDKMITLRVDLNFKKIFSGEKLANLTVTIENDFGVFIIAYHPGPVPSVLTFNFSETVTAYSLTLQRNITPNDTLILCDVQVMGSRLRPKSGEQKYHIFGKSTVI